ncbi:hypothetical protein TUMEXPCC7403_17440 [Tumidithrix helvetica PCC 7403]|uniref:hypothetical protein n=1 Tax=Tumidithrix helvetica TaxID=3457545 RepID=UPI003C80ABCD
MRITRLFLSFPIILSTFCGSLPLYAQTNDSSLPPASDTPEEVLRAEIYTEARSPIDGKVLTAAEYIELSEELSSLDRVPPDAFVSPAVRRLIGMLRLRKFLRQVIPFFP